MINFYGLRRRQTYDEVIDYLHNKQEILRFPKRTKLSPELILHHFPPSPEFAPLPPPTYPPPPDRGRERATSSRDPQWADLIDDMTFKYKQFFFDFL